MTHNVSLAREPRDFAASNDLPRPADDPTAEDAVGRLLLGHHLDRPQTRALFAELVAGRLAPPLMAAACPRPAK